jgi:hypothetical protein
MNHPNSLNSNHLNSFSSNSFTASSSFLEMSAISSKDRLPDESFSVSSIFRFSKTPISFSSISNSVFSLKLSLRFGVVYFI